MTNASKLADAYQAAVDASASYGSLCKELFPVGSDIAWLHRAHTCYGVVQHHGGSDRIHVRNDATGAEYWITGWHVIQAYKEMQWRLETAG